MAVLARTPLRDHPSPPATAAVASRCHTPALGEFPVTATVTHLSIWDEPEGGFQVFPQHLPLTGQVPVKRGNTFTLTDLELTFTP